MGRKYFISKNLEEDFIDFKITEAEAASVLKAFMQVMDGNSDVYDLVKNTGLAEETCQEIIVEN